ncbi:MAG: RluA family pseudouridine synthase [Planctomycetota bacterium]
MAEPLVLLADNHLLALAKPAGMPCVPDESGDRSLFDWAKDWVKREKGKPGAVYLGVVHRLDRPVSGLVVFARTSKGAARLSEAFRSRAVEKLYWAVSASAPRENEGVLEQWLLKDEARNVVRALAGERPGAQLARTRWRILARAADGARVLLEFRPETGRPHQLRVCAATLGAPLLGDLKYGAPTPLADKSIALHARALEFPHPTKQERVRLACEPPALPEWRF